MKTLLLTLITLATTTSFAARQQEYIQCEAIATTYVPNGVIKTQSEKFPVVFEKWAETVPFTLRNPLYHWTHLELQRYFGIHEVLSSANAKKVYDECNAKLQTKNSFSLTSISLNHLSKTA